MSDLLEAGMDNVKLLALANSLAEAQATIETLKKDLVTLETRKKKEVKRLVEKELLSYDTEIQRKKESIERYARLEAEERQKYKDASVKATMASIRAKALENAKEAVITLAVEIQDAFENPGMTDLEKQRWKKLSTELLNGYNTLQHLLGIPTD